MIQLEKKWAFITGATSGIGKSLSYKLAEKKVSLVITGRRESHLTELKNELENKFQISVLTLCFDIQDKNAMLERFNKHKEQLKKVSIVVNNAGLAKGVDPIDTGSTDDWDQMINTNVKGLLYITHYFLPILKEKSLGDIINIGSVAGRWTYPGGTVYSATKHAVLAISEGIRKDLCGSNIRVACIEPGMVNTEFSLARLGNQKQADAVYERMTPLSANDIAESIVWTLMRPAHVNIQEMVIYPTDQAHVTQVHRS